MHTCLHNKCVYVKGVLLCLLPVTLRPKGCYIRLTTECPSPVPLSFVIGRADGCDLGMLLSVVLRMPSGALQLTRWVGRRVIGFRYPVLFDAQEIIASDSG